ncbi:hypothetical protein HK102_003777 [Quaeritorhiza haematococci]|nr:hypothetical protein HK102_003777 [Quaeritorhiza haematococci]
MPTDMFAMRMPAIWTVVKGSRKTIKAVTIIKKHFIEASTIPVSAMTPHIGKVNNNAKKELIKYSSNGDDKERAGGTDNDGSGS